ncbi:M28 family peptidase [Cytophagaceae bacterium ABcell3]|nr:M28 family peptidase [Cytophagaceae bacterium ABcell3]
MSKKIFYSLALFLVTLLSFSLYSQDINRARETIEILSAPDMHGRGYVNNGDKIAAEYIQERFEQIGLKKIKNSYFQKFTFDINTFPGQVKLHSNRRKFVPGEDYILKPFSGAGKGRGRLVYFDTLALQDSEVRNEFLKKNLKRKIVVYDGDYYGRMIEFPGIVEKVHEAKAVVELESNKLTMGLSSKQYSRPFFQVYADSFDQSARRARFKVEAELIKDYESQNVIGYVRGKTNPDSLVVICAHYDHLGRLGEDTYFPGANDNASGTAMLLELADYYAKPENQMNFSIAFIAFGAEEAGLVGSKYFVDNPLFPLKNIKFLVNLDMMGTGDDGVMVVNGKVFENEFQTLKAINKEHNLLPQIKARGEAANSDHYFFYLRGVPCFFLYTLGGIAAYHDVFDKAETLPLTRFEEVFTLLNKFVGGF